MQARQHDAPDQSPTRGQTLRPASKALLPVEAYTSSQWFEREQQQLFAQTWQFVGMRERVWSQAGHYECVDIGRAPILSLLPIRTGNCVPFTIVCQSVAVAPNSCPAQANSTPVFAVRITTGSYSLSGALQGLPQPDLFPTSKRTQLGLLPAAG